MEKELLYLTRGYLKKYPIAFMSPYKTFMYQTTEFSSDGTPRYSCNPNSKSTYWIATMRYWVKFNNYLEIQRLEDLELISDLLELGLDPTKMGDLNYG